MFFPKREETPGAWAHISHAAQDPQRARGGQGVAMSGAASRYDVIEGLAQLVNGRRIRWHSHDFELVTLNS